MKKLEKIIKEAILEVLAESPTTIDVPNPSNLTGPQKQTLIQKAKTSTKNPKIGTAELPVEFVEEGEIDEARNPVQFKIGDEDKVKEYMSSLSGTKQQRFQKIIDLIKDKGQMAPASIALALGKTFVKDGKVMPRQAAVNPDIIELAKAGALIPVAGTGVAPSRVDKVTGEIAPKEEEPETFEPDDYFIGSKFATREPKPDPTPEEVAASFRKALSAGNDEESFMRNLPKDAPEITKKVSGEDYDKLIKYLNLKDRLNNIKSNIRQNRKLGKGGDDLGGGNVSKENEELTKKLEDTSKRINDLILSSEYLQSRKELEGGIKENKQRRLKRIN